ncbi:MAG: ArsA family ATPase [Acidobacteria bacterium]|nr:ArsA family ATPase [Acidobacteriota bacterium]
MRIIIYTGKGGVGKTSVAAAAALRSAMLGHRTLILSTDAAHSLSDVFEEELSHEAKEITNNLWAMEANVYTDLEENWGAVRAHIAKLVALQGMDEVLADEAAILPGMDELFSLARIKELSETNKYDCIVVDAAPTGETLRLLALPQTLSWSVKLLRRADHYIIKPLVRPLAKFSPGIEEMLTPEEVIVALENMLKKLKAMKKLLADTSQTTVRLVMNPEKMVIKESKRALTYLNMYGLLVDSVVVNRVLAANSGYLEGWREIQQRYLDEVTSDFTPLPIHQAPQYGAEVVGQTGLNQLAKDLYGEQDPTNIMFKQTVFEITKHNEEYKMRVCLPMLDRKKMRIRNTGSELVLQLENQRRIISLPAAMTGYKPVKANYEQDYLVIQFAKINTQIDPKNQENQTIAETQEVEKKQAESLENNENINNIYSEKVVSEDLEEHEISR